jgi:hypothetical protein
MSILQRALDLAAKGRAVFPMNPTTKRPACEHGVKDATTDQDKLHGWFNRPGLLPAVATGQPSSVVVLDVDAQHGGAEWWRENRHRLPETEAYRSRSGGLHAVFAYKAGLRTIGLDKIGKGVELRSTGASAIYWPAAGLPVLCDALPADLPSWVSPPPPAPPAPRYVASGPRPAERILKQVMGLVRVVASAPQGQRNASLFWAASRASEIIGQGELSAAHAEAVLVEAAARSGLDQVEARQTIQSAFRREATQ